MADNDLLSVINLESLGSHLLFGPIEQEVVKSAIEFIILENHLKQNEIISLFINTPGGAVSDGFALIDLMSISRIPIRTFGLGMVASMGVHIICTGTKGQRCITRNAEIMAHQFFSGTEGKHHELIAASRAAMYTEAILIRHLIKHTAMSETQIKDVLFSPTDRYLTPAECKKYGIIDIIIDEMPEDFSLANFFMPSVVKKKTSKTK